MRTEQPQQAAAQLEAARGTLYLQEMLSRENHGTASQDAAFCMIRRPAGPAGTVPVGGLLEPGGRADIPLLNAARLENSPGQAVH